jgi:hypothetical protein
MMQSLALAAVLFCALACAAMPRSADAQPTLLRPMTVETYRVLQRVSRNAGWASTAYKNYLVGLFEGVLSSEGSTVGDRHGKLFCIPAGKGSSIPATFEWMETELNNVVARSKPDALVARIFVSHLTKKYPCPWPSPM